MKNRIKFTATILALLILCLAGEAVAQVAPTCNGDDIFVGNFLGGTVVRFSKADIAINGNASASTVIGNALGSVEGMTLDYDGTVIVTTRGSNTVYRFDRTGTPNCIIATILTVEGPTFDAAGNMYVNDNGTQITYKSAPILGCPNLLSPVAWVNTYPAMTFTEDTRISPATAPMFPSSLYVLLTIGVPLQPNGVQAWSATSANTLLGTVISDFGTAAGLGAGSYQSVGMAFDSQGDIWVCDFSFGVGAGRLLEFNSAGVYQRTVTIPGSSREQVKIAISAPNPSDPLNPNRNTIYVTDLVTNNLYILDEVTGNVLFTLPSNLNGPSGVAVCDVIVQPPVATPTPGPTSTPQETPPPTPTPAPTPTATPPFLVSISGTVVYCPNPVSNPVANVTLTLTGSSSGPALSDSSGNYQFSSLASGGTYTVTPAKSALPPGSAGISTVDVIATQRHFLNVALLTGCRKAAADVNADALVNTVDVVAIQRFFLGLTTGIAQTGKYKFTPVNRSYLGLVSDQTGQNYDTLVFGDVASPFADRAGGPAPDAATPGRVSPSKRRK